MAMTSSSPPAADSRWRDGLHVGRQVEVNVYGRRMTGTLVRANPDSLVVRIPPADQSDDVRRFSVSGTAVISLKDAAATVPVMVRATGDLVHLQIVGPVQVVQRRRYVRVAVSVPVRLAWRAERGDFWLYAESATEDLSLGGVRVAPARVVWPSAGEEVLASFELPGGAVVRERARVAGKTPSYGLRLEFEQPGVEIQDWITSLGPPERAP